MPPSPWLEEDDDFYHAPTLPSLRSAAAPPAPSPAPAPTTIPLPLPTPTPAPARVASPPVTVPRESSRTLQPPHFKSPKTSEEPKPHQQQQQQQQPKQPKPPKQQPAAPAKIRKQPPPPLSPKPEIQARQENLNEQQKSPPLSPAALSPALTKYPPPPPLILYSDDQITISSLHLTIHAFYFPLNTPLTIPLLSITELETLPSAESEGGNSGGMAGWLKYKNWGVSALSDIWWARDPRQTTTTATTGGNLLTSTLGAAAAAVTVAVPLSRYSNKENTAPLVHVVVRVEGEWLRKGFGVEHERGVKILKDAWKNVKESELGLRPLRPAMSGMDADGEDDLLVIERAGGDIKHHHHDTNSNSNSNSAGSSEKRRWLTYQNTWTAYPFADDSPQFLAQQQRRGGMTGAGGGVVGVIGATLASKAAPRYRQLQRQRTGLAPQSSTTLHFGPDESCGDDPLFIDNDLNVHEEI
ncbi:hypothetical protein BGZ67_001085 [Mortierella alpina]|nr:hypothetical protein BGZ67_001085 [Mortierella alpina]